MQRPQRPQRTRTQPGTRITTPEHAWAVLRAGNARFMADARAHPHEGLHVRKRLAGKQNPFAIFFGCADSRVGAEIIFDVKCTRALFPWIRERGGRPLMWKTGHSLIKAKLRETGAPLAGEMSGHVFFKERWYGFDDGVYAGARLLEILSRVADVSVPLESLPDSVNTPELQIKLAEGENFKLIEKLQREAKFDGATDVITIDGVRAEYPDVFGLARASNTTPVVVLRFEGDNAAALARIQAAFRSAILAVAPTAQLPY